MKKNTSPDNNPAPDAGFIESLDSFFSGQRHKLDIQARLNAMATQAEQAIAALINLIVVFVMQTIVLPLGLLWLALHLFKLLWRATPEQHQAHNPRTAPAMNSAPRQ